MCGREHNNTKHRNSNDCPPTMLQWNGKPLARSEQYRQQTLTTVTSTIVKRCRVTISGDEVTHASWRAPVSVTGINGQLSSVDQHRMDAVSLSTGEHRDCPAKVTGDTPFIEKTPCVRKTPFIPQDSIYLEDVTGLARRIQFICSAFLSCRPFPSHLFCPCLV